MNGDNVASRSLTPKDASTITLPDSWDWRNVNGENWMTPVKDQGYAGTCWAFANVGALEAQINLYYNKHLDVNLSEQMVVDCSNLGPITQLSTLPAQCGGDNMCYPGYNYCKDSYIGVADENADLYDVQRSSTGDPSMCDYSHIASNWNSRVWKISSFHDYKFVSDRGTPQCSKQTMNLNKDEFKELLIQKGPLDSGITSWTHAMVLVGFNSSNDS
ncbi:MAG: C1 family peptidase [Candidatus Taylorbacteria bacterium]